MRPNPSTAMAEVIIDELARNGIGLIVISPGSRSAALAIAADLHPAVETVAVVDERAASFWALGRAKAGAGAAVVSTSGTAPANWFPAVVEADMSLTPLVLLSADRPGESRGVGANQTIDQVALFGAKVRFFADVPAPDGDDGNDLWREIVCRAAGASRGSRGQPGPVHLNVAFREPTVPVSDDGRTRVEPYPHATNGREGGAPWMEMGARIASSRLPTLPATGRGLVVAGEGAHDRTSLYEAANRLGWPVLATAMSGLRGQEVVDAYHHILADGPPTPLIPEVAVAVGAIGPSERLESLIASAAHRVRVDLWGRRIDPNRNATLEISGDPSAVLAAIPPEPNPRWVDSWMDAQRRVRKAVREEVLGGDVWTGARVATTLDGTDWGCLVVGSSLPVREVDAHLTRAGRVIGNRGASGIDGLVSTAFGVATAEPRTLALVGDLGLLHDANAFLSEEVGDLVVVVVDNGGGGLFDSLPTAAHAPSYERLFVTPHQRRFDDLARLHRLGHVRAETGAELGNAVDAALAAGGRTLVEVSVDRAADLAARLDLDAVARSVLKA